MEFDAVVVAGGGSTRLGGVDKALVVLDGVTFLDRVLRAADHATTTVVVGPVRTTYREVEWAQEDPPGSGPVAGLAAGLAQGNAPIVVVLSCDLPWVTAEDIARLVSSIDTHDGSGLRDSDGRDQWLAAAYKRSSLEHALQRLGDPRDQSVRRLTSDLDLVWSEPSRSGDDVDTWADLDG
ncbi:molybdenum cofactor guanylyltransferase [Kribbella antibiotica]|uniref:Molybdenum cofactor guanylyltransferase n=1 Tax=Kribbella antibiotica TaxID=190195 RepID=A0A4R4ZKW2_9ACTN|nr:molybdenum cofactor guanylyltransferase [Kribbella antibiotica]TDD57422.1 molybdenum cofactor guanylyltransferase [Kribbella antibiotica]